MKATMKCIAALAVAWTLVWSTDAFAQDNGWTGGIGNWTDGTWQFFAPPHPDFDARGIVGSTAGSSSPVGEVNVTTDISVSNPTPTVVLGDGAGTSGTLNITSPTGHLSVVIDGGGGAGSTGILSVGAGGGIGLLNVTGTLDVAGELESRNTADGGTTITLSGSAVVNANSGFLDRNFIVDGSNVSATFASNLVLGSSGTHTWKIPATGASTVLVGGNADLGGTLKVEFPSGTPTLGSGWNLIDSATVDDGESPATGFGNVDQSAVSGLVTGSTFAVKSVADGGSINGTYTRLTLEQHPVLVIDRSTGATSIQNFHGSAAAEDFDAYVIGSSGEYLNPGSWSSIDPTNGWVEAASSSTTLSELNPTAFESIAASTSISLGTPFAAPSAFGEENEDITFRFSKPDESTFTDGRVLYTGVPNNTLTLNVDPDTGEAQIVNGTSFTVSIDAYVVSSANGSLNFADGSPTDTWNSLEDQGTTDWYEANNVSNERISELLVTGGMELAPNDTVNLGSPFNDPLGEQDLVFQFALVSGGDYNENGFIDAADYTTWRDAMTAGSSTLPNDPTPGTVDESDFLYWRDHFGETTTPGSDSFLIGKVLYGPLVTLGSGSGAGSAAVPEPGTGTLVLVCLAVSAIVTSGRRRSLKMCCGQQ